MSVKMRQIVEKEIAAAVVDTLLKAGFSISVDNGDNTGGNGDYELKDSTSKRAVLKAMFQTDEERLYVSLTGKLAVKGVIFGWVYFIYGNDGWGVINDYTVNLESHIGEGSEVQKVIDKYSD